MSLLHTARHLAAQGRGPDTTLVHMTPNEVRGLQALAKAHGGSLTINPKTGLVEAGILDKIIPVAAGAALTAMGVPAPFAAGIVGAVSGVRSGSLRQGLLAGLSAYGGSSMAESVMASRAAAAAPTGATATGSSAIDQAAAEQSLEAAKNETARQVARSGARVGYEAPSMFQTAMTPATVTPPMALPSAASSAATESAGAGLSDWLAANRGSVALGYMGLNALAAQDQPKVPTAPPTPTGTAPVRSRPKRLIWETPPETGGIGERIYYSPRFVEYAEGGATTAAPKDTPKSSPMTGASQYLYEYLMGQQPSSRLPYELAYSNTGTSAGTAPVAPSTPAGPRFEAAPHVYAERDTKLVFPEIGQEGESSTRYQYATDPATGERTAHTITFSAADAEAMRQDVSNRAHRMPLLRPDLPWVSVERLPGPNNEFRQYIVDQNNPEEVQKAYDNLLYASVYGWSPIPTYARGGGITLENGGFVVPADVVSALGNGSSSAGLELLSKRIGARPIHGPGDGMSDSIPTTIAGKQRAAIAREEAYVPAETVAKLGGADRLYAMMDNIRSQAHGKKTQQRKVSPRSVPTK